MVDIFMDQSDGSSTSYFVTKLFWVQIPHQLYPLTRHVKFTQTIWHAIGNALNIFCINYLLQRGKEVGLSCHTDSSDVWLLSVTQFSLRKCSFLFNSTVISRPYRTQMQQWHRLQILNLTKSEMKIILISW